MAVNWSSSRRCHRSIVDAIGRTPMVRLGRIPAVDGVRARILVKLEYFSPSGSLKDRVYRNMFERAERRGALKPGMTVLECSTGNAGIGCSFVAAVKGYPCIIVMPEGMSEERKKLDLAYGATMVYTPGGESDVDLALRKLEEIRLKNPQRYFVPAQFENPDNVEAHIRTTGPEIWEQTGGRIDAFIMTQGTGGTLTGVGRYIRRRRKALRLFAIEPAECPLLSRRTWGPHGIEGIGDGFVPENLDVSLLDGIVTATTGESIEMARRLARDEGIFCGISSGANVAGAIKLARAHQELKTIVTLICDTGQRYFSTELCGCPKHVDVPEREHPMDARTVSQLDRYQGRWEIID
ncbi:MAG TPA: PLP-dependent cysteine synthase family protein [Vicinamibacterales bacterium]|nr:PLP-dependent cysteine synthase family protein [Vicinamibacterales bacterium]HPW20477.1 PLP-dependent cysteine synthase family protein [Vicinamibacterales bacterium]